MHPLTPIVCVTGADGTGKSTLIAGLCARLRDEAGLAAREVTVWDLLTQAEVGSAFPIEPRRIDMYLALLSPLGRAHFLLHCWAEAMQRAAQAGADLLLVNGYWYKYLACEVAHGASESTLIALTTGFPEPALTFYIEVPIATCAGRKQRFSGYESGFTGACDAAAFAAFQERVRPVLSRWCTSRGWKSIDGTQEPGAVLGAAIPELKLLVRER